MNAPELGRWGLMLRGLLGEALPALPELPGRVHRAPPPPERDAGHPREASLCRALALAAGIADRRHWRHRA